MFGECTKDIPEYRSVSDDLGIPGLRKKSYRYSENYRHKKKSESTKRTKLPSNNYQRNDNQREGNMIPNKLVTKISKIENTL